VEIKVLREYLVDDPEEDERPNGARIQLRLFELQIGPHLRYVSAEQKPIEGATSAPIFTVDGRPGGTLPASGYHKLLAARDEYLATKRATERTEALAVQSTREQSMAARAADRAHKEAWHQSIAQRREADSKAKAARRKAQMQGKLLRLKAEAVRVNAEIAALELELLAL
jgi:hypothetical protein